MAYGVDSFPVAGETGIVYDTNINTLGTVAKFSDGNYYIWLQGVASTATGDWAVYKPGVYLTARMTTGMKGSVAVATAAVVASKYGWYGYSGSFSANCLSATLSNGYLYATATAGSAEDAITKNEQIQRATALGAALTATGGGLQSVAIDQPTVGAYDESV